MSFSTRDARTELGSGRRLCADCLHVKYGLRFSSATDAERGISYACYAYNDDDVPMKAPSAPCIRAMYISSGAFGYPVPP